MNDDSVLRRLRAARPAAAEPGSHDALFARIVAEPGDPRLVAAPRERSSRFLGRKVLPWARPRVLAGSTLGLAAVGVALVVALSGSTAPPAYAITRHDDGSVVVNINQLQSLPDVNRKLNAMGINSVTIYMARGAAAVSGPVTCAPAPGTDASGPTVRVLVGKDGTETISPGETAGNSGVGSWHLNRCVLSDHTGSTITGNPGAR